MGNSPSYLLFSWLSTFVAKVAKTTNFVIFSLLCTTFVLIRILFMGVL